MKIQFQIVSINMHYKNLIHFENLNHQQLKEVKALTKKSPLKYDRLVSDLINKEEGDIECTYNLDIHLPNWVNWEIYGNYEHVFAHPDYATWKSNICAHFPDLNSQFALSEKLATNRQELYRLENSSTISSYHFLRNSLGLFGQRIMQLRNELRSENQPCSINSI